MRGASLTSSVNEGSSWSWSSSGTSAQIIDRNLLFDAPQSKRCFVLFSNLCGRRCRPQTLVALGLV
jgi:hypothetical protein